MNKRELERAENRLKKRLNNLTKTFENMYQLDNIERIQEFKEIIGYTNYSKKVVRSISLTSKNDDFITQVQTEAKEVGNFISKDIIINIALYELLKEKEEKQLSNFNDWLRNYL